MEDNQFRESEEFGPLGEEHLAKESIGQPENPEGKPGNKEEENKEENKEENEEEWTEAFKLELAARFCHWLRKQHLRKIAEAASIEPSQGQPPQKVDLFTLFSELAALRQETKITSRQMKSGMEQWEKMYGSAQQTIDLMQREQNQRRAEQTSQKALYIRPLLLGILDIRDRMEQGIEATMKARSSSWLVAKLSRGEEGMEELIEGQKMTVRNLDRLLSSYGVAPMEAEGKNFDPHTMRAVEVEERRDLPNGQVIEEIRKGFLLNEETLRPAEVKVNKHK